MKKALFQLALMLVCLMAGCQKQPNPNREVQVDLPQIVERGKLVVLMEFSSTGYFLYRGQPMGYEFELLSMLADYLKVDLEIKIVRDLDRIEDPLLVGTGDLIAHSMARTKQRTARFSFTEPHLSVPMVLVQRLPEGWRKMKRREIERELLRNPVDLIGKKVHVRRQSSYHLRLQNLSEEIGGEIEIVEISGNLSNDDLMKKVASGEIEYTIIDQNIAQINQTCDPDIDIKTLVSMPQQIGWIVRKSSPMLLDAVNDWMTLMRDSTDFYVIYNKYFKNRTAMRKRVESEYFSSYTGSISPFDSTIKVQAQRLDWDWRLLASQIYQESQFDPRAKSWSGAVGLMQLMPATARQYGGINLHDPRHSIEVGVNYLVWLDEYWKKEISDSTERIKFVLGSYNVGFNHINDARRLAIKFGKSDLIWDDHVTEFLVKKSKQKFYHDEVVHYGYCRGLEPVNYVAEIFERYQHYLKFTN